jgi:hypothetical protein
MWEQGGPTPVGARAADISEAVKPYLMEVALNEQVCSALLVA